jgi:hypothetical protein
MALAGLASNLLALASRPTLVLLGVHVGMGRSEQLGWMAVASYAGCGLAAGLISAACWFRLHSSPAEKAA